MRIGETARRAGVNIETLRYYERRGLLPEPPRTPFGHRSYDEETVRFVRAIKEAQGLGFTLTEIAEYLRLVRRSGGAVSETMRVTLATKIAQVDAKIASLRRVRDDLARVLGCACDSLDHCTCGAAYLARRGRDPELEPDAILHVINGESAGNSLRQSGIHGPVLPWQDTLHEGPVPRLPAPQLRELRATFLSECGWGSRRAILGGLERRDRLLQQALADERPVVLWFEHDLYDQLQLLQVLAFAGESGAQVDRLELIQIGTFDGMPNFHGLGELNPDQLESLWPKRRPVTDETIELGVTAWEAFRAPDPGRIPAFLAGDSASLPFLAAALLRLLEELPAVEDGLARSERQLLEALAAGPKTPGQLFRASQEGEEAPFEGDTWCYRRLARLASGESPLLASASGDPLPDPPPLGEPRSFVATPLMLTEAGRAVLDGKADAIELNGIDRWLGGVHLRPDSLWRWDRARGRIA